jgi:hypothetical protein
MTMFFPRLRNVFSHNTQISDYLFLYRKKISIVRKHDCANVNFENVRKRVSPSISRCKLQGHIIHCLHLSGQLIIN